MRKGLRGIILICAMIFSLTVTAVPIYADKAGKSDGVEVKWPKGPGADSLACQAAVVMELSSGLVLYNYNGDVQNYPASITKIMTAAIALENSSLSEEVTFSENAVYGIEADSSNVSTDIGEVFTMEQCLYAIMLESANEVCLGVGEHIAGSVTGFVDMMNQKVTELGLKNTHFANPNGLHNDNHYTSAYDMAVIARTAMKNSTFRKITASKTYQMPKTNKHKKRNPWRNHHQMINAYDHPEYEYDYAIGGKTGYTQMAQSTLVTFAEKDGMELVCVIMRSRNPEAGEPNEYSDTIRLLNFGFENYKKYSLDSMEKAEESPLFTMYSPFFDKTQTNLRLSDESSLVLPIGADVSEAKQTITYNESGELREGENIIGTVHYEYGGKDVGSTNIIYDMQSGEKQIAAKSVDDIINNMNEKIKKEQEKAKKPSVLKKIFNLKNLVRLVAVLAAAAFVFLLFKLVTRKRKGVRYHRRHKRTIESFNRNFMDFH